jgi:gas vesicle protein
MGCIEQRPATHEEDKTQGGWYMDNSGKTTVAFLLGAVAGGILGIIFAPKSGKETRSDLQRYMKEAESSFQKKKNEIKDAASRQLDKIKEQVNKTFKEGKENIEKGDASPAGGEKGAGA